MNGYRASTTSNLLLGVMETKRKFESNDMYHCFFQPTEDSKVHTCLECSKIEHNIRNKVKFSIASGYNNAWSHVRNHHPNYSEVITAYVETKKKESPSAMMMNNFKVTKFSQDLYGWLQMIIMADNSFSIVENKIYQSFSKYGTISRPTIMKYLNLLHKKVLEKLSREVPEHFGAIFDGWTCDGPMEHYFAYFLVWSTNTGYNKCLLTCDVLEKNEAGAVRLSAENIVNQLTRKLILINKNLSQIDYIGGDNASVNIKVAKLINVPFVGCASHRLALAVKLLTDKNIANRNVILKVHTLMKKLRTIINRSILREYTHLAPEIRNQTRWSSCYNMLIKYMSIKDCPTESYEEDVLQLFPSMVEINIIRKLCEDLECINKISIALQSEGNHVNLAYVRIIFDGNLIFLFHMCNHFIGLIEKYPTFRKYLGTDSNIIKFNHFENAITKLQSQKEDTLSINEKEAISNFKFECVDMSNEEVHPLGDTVLEESFADTLLKNANKMVKNNHNNSNQYRSVNHILPTSNICERLFSIAKLIKTDNRKTMSPSNLNRVLFLRFNRNLWDEKLVNTLKQYNLESELSNQQVFEEKLDEEKEDEENEDEYLEPHMLNQELIEYPSILYEEDLYDLGSEFEEDDEENEENTE